MRVRSLVLLGFILTSHSEACLHVAAGVSFCRVGISSANANRAIVPGRESAREISRSRLGKFGCLLLPLLTVSCLGFGNQSLLLRFPSSDAKGFTFWGVTTALALGTNHSGPLRDFSEAVMLIRG